MCQVTKSERTRAALRDAALRHFAAHGFDAASVPAIAAEAGVTERTFYRHFATKDEVLHDDLLTRLEWFRTALRERPPGEDLLRSVFVSLTSAPTDPELLVEIAALRSRLLSPARIERAVRDRQGAMAAEVREVLIERGAPPLAAAVRAEAVAGAVFAALAVWTEGPGPRDVAGLGRVTAEALELVRPVLG